jgi:hypothetical protein
VSQKFGGLTDDELDELAEKAAKKALNLVYQEVGRGVVRKVAWALGVSILGFLGWLGTKGLIK